MNLRQHSRSDRRQLPVSNDWIDIVQCQLERETWWIVEAASEGAMPFDLEVDWGAGESSGVKLQMTVATGTRTSVFGSTVKARARNLSDKTHVVKAMISTGFAHTTNHLEHRATTEVDVPLKVVIPPFACRYELHLPDPAWLDKTSIRVIDGKGVARARFVAINQPLGGIVLGGASSLEIRCIAAVELRGIFTLTM